MRTTAALGESAAVSLDTGAPSLIQIDAADPASVIREQKPLPIAEHEAERLAGAIETSTDDEAFLANALSAVRFLLDRLDDASAADALEHATPMGRRDGGFGDAGQDRVWSG